MFLDFQSNNSKIKNLMDTKVFEVRTISSGNSMIVYGDRVLVNLKTSSRTCWNLAQLLEIWVLW